MKPCCLKPLYPLAVVALLLASGCGESHERYRPEAREAWSSTLRFIEETPQWLYSIDEISRREQTFTWAFTGSPHPTWSARGPGVRSEIAEDMLVLRLRRNGKIHLEAKVDIDSSAVDEIEVQARGLRPGQFLQLFWSRDDEDFAGRRSVRVGQRQAEGQSLKTFRFELAGRPEWSGKITGLRLSGELEAGQRLRLGVARGSQRALESDSFAAAVQRPWQTLLGGELRSALMAIPEVPRVRELTVPEQARLQLAYGLPGGYPESLRFQVVVEDAAEVDHLLLDQELDPGIADGGWRVADLDLAPWSGQRVRLGLRTSAERAPDPLAGVGWWGTPQVIARELKVRLPNVILISVDTLRADRLSTYGYSRPTSPEIDRWARRRGVVFEQAVAAAPWTLPSHASMFSGLDALSHGVNHPAPVPRSITTLAERLWQAGYFTRGVVGGSYLHPEFGLAQGFDSYSSYKGDLDEELEVQMETTLSWLHSEGERHPFFLLFHTYEVHDPYRLHQASHALLGGAPLPEEADDAFVRSIGPDPERGYRLGNEVVWRRDDGSLLDLPVDSEGMAAVSDLYDDGVAFTDRHLGRLFDALEDLGLADDTLVVLTSDHGEAFGEHGLAGHGALYDHDLLVPLVIAFPGGFEAGRRIDRQVRSIDLVPTILETVGLVVPENLDGAPLSTLLLGEREDQRPAVSYAALSNHGVALRVDGQFKYIFANSPWGSPNAAEELYDLRRDPRESHDLATTSSHRSSLHETLVASLRRRAAGLLLELINPSSRLLHGTLRGEMLAPATVKTSELGLRCRLGGRGILKLEVPPGDKLSLRLEGVTGDLTLGVELGLEGDPPIAPFELEMSGAELESGAVWSLADEGWVVGEPDSRAAPSLRLVWRGVHRASGPSPADTDPELRKQLEALGYID